MSYFNNILKRAENDIEVEMIKKKLQDYGTTIGTADDYGALDLFLAEFEKKAEKKIEECKNRTALVVLKDNFVYRIIRKLKRFFIRSEKEY